MIRIEPGDDHVLALIDTPEFQRLRRIRQLGVSFLTYHGAEHSRFAHSMGVFNFAQRIVQALRRRYAEHNEVATCLDSHHKQLTAAALLHDVGHGPFSHLLERAFQDSPKHEDRTVTLILEAESGLGRVLDAHSIDRDAVASIIQGTHPCRLIVDIVSSQLDADRMDYLLRDSLHTGVEYGRYDSEWVLNSLCIGIDPNADARGSTSWRLCLDKERGLYPAEQLILARAHMTMQVYFHRVTRGYEVLLLNMFKQAAELGESLPSATPGVVREFFVTRGKLEHAAWLRFDEAALTAALHIWADCQEETDEIQVLRRLARAFLSREPVYKGISVPPDLGLGIVRLAQTLEAVGLRNGRDWALDDAEQMPYKGVMWTAARDPVRSETETFSATSILLSSGNLDDHAKPIEAESDVLQHLSPLAAPRFFYDRSKRDQIFEILSDYGFDRA